MKLGIAGAGTIVQEVLPHLAEWGWDTAALCGTPASHEKTQALAQANAVPAVYNEYALMLKEADIDTVYVAVPNSLH